ncbi:uncharacterized protein [Prorops nasuta]|uniref:uncharacterized protein n=1 Tax=Prorops nasuta TaxID=863751 RepID=UPI0034CE27A4
MSVIESDSPDFRAASSRRKVEKRPPFRLCFSRHQQIGKSDAGISQVKADSVAWKFYSRQTEPVKNLDVRETAIKIAKEENKMPKDKYRWPLLTSHTYGWWHDKGNFPKDPRFNFHKKTSDLVSFQIKIYAEDRKTRDDS